MSVLHQFHPLIQEWFLSRFRAPTEPQESGWPEILAGHHTLIAAPTGSGKTLTAFLASIDRLFREGLNEKLPEQTRILYVSPLRALSNDMQRNLEIPLGEIQGLAQARGISFSPIRVGLRTGDTSPAQRQAAVKHPPPRSSSPPRNPSISSSQDKKVGKSFEVSTPSSSMKSTP